MISAILIYGQRGEILVSRIYKDGLRRAVTDAFRAQVISNAEIQAPLLTMGSTSFLHIRYNNMYVVAITRHDVDGIAVFELLYKLCDVCNSKLGTFDEAACYRHVSHIYEILDEILDFGFPQNVESGLLRLSGTAADAVTYTDNFGARSNSNGNGSGITGAVSSLRRSLTSAKPPQISNGGLNDVPGKNVSGRAVNGSNFDVPWRRSDVKHRRNEIYLDVLEKLNMVFEPNGNILSANVDGILRVKTHLSGLPHCQVDLDRVSVLENSQLHACVDHSRFHEDGVIQFVPPEGEFDLLRYRVSRGVRVPFSIQNEMYNGDYVIKIRCTLEAKRHLTNVVISVPLPADSTSNSQRMKASSGKARFASEQPAVEWKIARLSGQSEATLRISRDNYHGNHHLSSAVGHGPIMVKFLINMYTCSTLHVMALQVIEDSKYSTLKWVRYLTETGACEARSVAPNDDDRSIKE